jgi:hypothetical protein
VPNASDGLSGTWILVLMVMCVVAGYLLNNRRSPDAPKRKNDDIVEPNQ